MDKLNEWGPMTVLMVIAAVIVLGIGGVVVILNPDTYGFGAYLDDLKTFALALAGLGVGRGILAAGKSIGEARVQASALAMPGEPVADVPREEDDEDDLDLIEPVEPDVLDDLEVADDLETEVLPAPHDLRPAGERPDDS